MISMVISCPTKIILVLRQCANAEKCDKKYSFEEKSNRICLKVNRSSTKTDFFPFYQLVSADEEFNGLISQLSLEV